MLRPLFEAGYRIHFNRATGLRRLFRGVFSSFEEATATAPKRKLLGYNNEESAKLYDDHIPAIRIMPSDYPVMFWLQRLLIENLTVFDHGGNLGISYYSYRTRMPYPPGIQWIICDLPEVNKLGRKLAKQRDSQGLSFTERAQDMDGADVLIAAGSLQYIDEPIAGVLCKLKRKPAHIILNKLPVHEDTTFVTLQNTGASFCPYRIFKRQEFVAGLTDLGYRLVDSWTNPDFPCKIPFYPRYSFPAFSGMYLCLQTSAKEHARL